MLEGWRMKKMKTILAACMMLSLAFTLTFSSNCFAGNCTEVYQQDQSNNTEKYLIYNEGGIEVGHVEPNGERWLAYAKDDGYFSASFSTKEEAIEAICD